ncbi:MAG: sulfate permease [Balneolales bacterium]|nr:sulfate permease [Balneolales bacterium]
MLSSIKKRIPAIEWLSGYESRYFKGDLAAGITVGVLLIPQGMAYALIAGLPAVYGLYAALAPLVFYALAGTSRHLAVGPVALIALLIASTVSPLASSPEEYIALSITLALLTGVIQLLFGILRLGFIVNLMSHPVLTGFISAAAVVIGLSQFHHLIGVNSSTGTLPAVLYGIFTQIMSADPATISIGAGSILLLLLLKHFSPKLPAAVLAVVAGILMMFSFQQFLPSVSIIGSIDSGLPSFMLPDFNMDWITSLLPMAMAIALVGYIEAVSVAKAIQHKSKEYEIDANQELIALGGSNIAGSFFQSFPVTGSFSRTAINFSTGGHTPMASFISAGVVLLTLLFLTPVFYYLPHAVLGAIIIVSVAGLIDYKAFFRLWKLGHYDRYLLLITFAGTLFLGIKEGILAGVFLSVIMLLYRSARPNMVVLGKIPGTGIYRDIRNYKTESIPGILMVRFDGPLHFANAAFFKNELIRLSAENTGLKHLIIDLNGVNDIDSTGLDEMLETIHYLKTAGINPLLTEAKFSVRKLLKKATEDACPPFYMRIEDAVHAAEKDELHDSVTAQPGSEVPDNTASDSASAGSLKSIIYTDRT